MKLLGVIGGETRFRLGYVVATPGALNALVDAGMHPAELLHRHSAGDWGDLSGEDAQQNDRSVTAGLRILSAYVLAATQHKVWIITEADRSCTTLLLPEEY